MHWNWSCTCFSRYQMHLYHSMNKYTFPATNFRKRIYGKITNLKGGKKDPFKQKSIYFCLCECHTLTLKIQFFWMTFSLPSIQSIYIVSVVTCIKIWLVSFRVSYPPEKWNSNTLNVLNWGLNNWHAQKFWDLH